MKKKILTGVFIYIFFMIVGKVKGYNLDLELSLENRNGTDYYVFYTYVGASPHSKEVFRSNPQNIPGQDYIKPEAEGDDYTGTWNSYDITGITFHPKTGEKGKEDFLNKTEIKSNGNYDSSDYKNNKISIYYDTGTVSKYSKGNTEKGYILYQNWFGMYDGILGFESYRRFINKELQLTYQSNTKGSGANFYTEYTLDKDAKGNYNIVKYKYLIKASYLNALKKEVNYRSLDADGDDKVYTFHVSMQITALYGNGNHTKIYTAEQFYYYMYKIASENGRYWGPWSRGSDYSGNPVAGTSAANDFDNYLKLYEFNGDGSSVSVAHMIKGTQNYLSGTETVKKETTTLTPEYNYNVSNQNNHIYNFDFTNKTSTMIHVSNTSENGIIRQNGVNYKCVGYNIMWGDGKKEEYSESNTRDILNTTLYFGKSMIEGAQIIFFYEPESKLSRNIYIAYRDITNNKWLGIAPNDFNAKNNNITNEYSKYKYTDSSGNEVLLYDWIEYYRTSQQITAYAINDKNKLKLEDNKEYKYAGFKVYKNTNNRNASYDLLTTEYKSGSGTEYKIDDSNSSFLIVFNYEVGEEVKQPKLFYSYIEVELDTDGKYKYSKTLEGPYEENNNGENIEVPIKNYAKHYPVGYAVENGGIDKGYTDLFITENIVNDLKTLPNKIIFKGAKHTDKNYLIVVLYLKYKPITYNLFVYRRAIDEIDENNKKIQSENLKIGINPEGNKVTASIGTVKSFAKKECREYTITLEDDRKPTTVTVKNILESDMSEDQIIEYKFAGKWSHVKQSDTSKLKDYDSDNGINYHLNKTLTSRDSYLWLYYKEDKPKTVTICPILSFEAANSAFKTTPYAECDDSDGKYNSECDPSKIESIYIPAGEDVTTKIANAPKIMFLNYNDADSFGRRGGIWQKLDKYWVEINNDILNQYKKAAGIENSKNFGAKELYQKYKGLINSITKDEIVQEKNGKYYVMKYKYTIIGHSLLYMDKIYVDSSNNNISSENQVYKLSEIKGTSVYKKMEEYYAKTSYSVLSQKKNIFGCDQDYTNKVISELNKMKDNLYTENIKIPDNAPNGVNIASARINYVTSRSGITVFNKNSSISKYLWVDGDSGSNTIINVPINKRISELYRNTNTSKAGINVLVPANISSVKVEAAGQVNHSDDKDISNAIQNHSNLTVTANMGTPAEIYKNITSLKELLNKKITSYIKSYVYIFDFNVQRLDGGKPTGEPTKIIKSNSNQISVYVNDDSVENNKNGSAVKDYVNNITVLAFTKNTPDDYIENSIQIAMKTTTNEKWKEITYSKEIYSIQDCSKKTTNNIWSKTLVDRNEEISQDAYYVVKASKTIASIGRIYDFRITDCTDVDFKSVFRKSGQGQGVNSLTGTVYFSGIKELQIFGNGVNSLDLRKDPKTLPLGPYKHTNSNYVDAPKMGYRISFDVKTTGKYVTTKDDANKLSNNYKKYVKITPSYYYIKKDGSGYNENITLYYKNSSNKYVKFIGSGFKISYKPNDGYRNVTNLGITNITDMFTDKYVTLDVSSKDGFNLNIDSMCTNYNGYVQSWYGEFKLPNTTIAVENDDVNKPLTDGYLGVKFDISCFYVYNGITKKVSYNTLDKNASGTNTTQWDYEGYLGFKNAGKDVTGNDGLYLQFPKGKLMISSQILYEQIRGTVVFFDLDNRASNDFE